MPDTKRAGKIEFESILIENVDDFTISGRKQFQRELKEIINYCGYAELRYDIVTIRGRQSDAHTIMCESIEDVGKIDFDTLNNELQ